METEQIRRIEILWKIDDQVQLQLMLSQSGALNRRGDGTQEPTSLLPAMGSADEPLFEHLLENLPSEWLAHAGRYHMPDPEGNLLDLSIMFASENEESGIQFVYGSDSQGPPEDLVEFVELALELTDPWYEAVTHKQRKKK